MSPNLREPFGEKQPADLLEPKRAIMERIRASPETSKIPVLRSAGQESPWSSLESKLKQLDEQALSKTDPSLRLLAACCRDSALLTKQLQGQVEALRAENTSLRQQLKKTQQKLDDCCAAGAEHRQEFEVHLARLKAHGEVSETKLQTEVRALSDRLTKVSLKLDDVPDAATLSRRLRDTIAEEHKTSLARVEESVKATVNETGSRIALMGGEVEALAGRVVSLETTQQAAEQRQRLLDEAEPTGAQRTFQDLQLLRSSREPPFRWQLSGYQRLAEQARRESQLRVYSRPFGIEKEGGVRCVLRLAVGLGVPAGQEGGDAVQFGLQLLHAAKCNKKFDFCLRIVDRSGQDRHLVKTFSSSELIVPRFWFSRPASGLVSFAVLVSEQRLLEGLLFKDTLLVEVGVQ